MIAFHHPAYLIGAAAFIAYSLVGGIKERGGRRLFHRAVRTCALALIVAALAEPFIERERESSTSLVLLDISDSMDVERTEAMTATLRRFGSEGADFEIVPFARETALTSTFSNDSYRAIKNAWFKLDVGASNLERALQNTLGRQPSSVLLISDGFETEGDALSLAPALKSRGFKVYPLVPTDAPGESGFRISHLHSPLLAPSQKSVDIRVSVLNRTEQTQRGVLTVTHDGKAVLERDVTVEPGEELLTVAASDPSKEGIKEITATLKPRDTTLTPTSETTYLSGQTRERILLLNGADEDGRFLAQVLKDQAYQLTSMNVGDRLGALPPLSDFSTVILNNVARAQLPPAAPDEIDRFVKAGGGFLMIGGNRSFGLGGYLRTPIEDLLPVQILPPQTVKKRLNVAVALVLDKSKSMAYGDRIEYAKEAARESIKNLKDDDFVTVIGFDSAPFVVVKLGQLAAIRAEAMERVGRLFPANKTALLPALEEARRALVRANAGRKHMIVLTDGRIPDEGPYYPEFVRQMRLLGITVSTVLVGGDVDTGMLSQMAELGGGAYYQVADPRSLPRIFISDIKVSTGERSLKESEEFLVRGTSARTSTEISSFPPVRGYVETKPKDRAALELVAFTDDKAEPLLATWEYGAGRSGAFTSDVSGRWSNYWLTWSKFQTFWSDVLKAVRPSRAEKDAPNFDLRTFYEHGLLNLDLTVFSEAHTGGLSAALVLPDGSSRDITFAAPSRGRFRAQVGNVMAGKYELRARLGATPLTPVAFYLSGELFGEKKGRGVNAPLLNALASGTGGAVNPDPAEVHGQVYTQTERHELGAACLLLAAIMLTLAIVWREVFLSGRALPTLRLLRRPASSKRKAA